MYGMGDRTVAKPANPPFTINPMSGVILNTGIFDAKSAPQYQFNVLAEDNQVPGATIVQTAFAKVYVSVDTSC